MCLTMALGLDSFLVIRHGIGEGPPSSASGPLNPAAPIPGTQLACYFCADVTAPGNVMMMKTKMRAKMVMLMRVQSTGDRTLDQQCTVSRPGLSLACAGTGVEVLAAAAQHPDWPAVPAANAGADEEGLAGPLGLVPHQVRAYVSRCATGHWARLHATRWKGEGGDCIGGVS